MTTCENCAETITAKWLRDHGACDTTAFVKEWPRGAKVTAKNIRRAAKIGLDLDWFAEKVLDAPALAEYEKARAPALAECQKARAPALIRALKLKEKRR